MTIFEQYVCRCATVNHARFLVTFMHITAIACKPIPDLVGRIEQQQPHWNANIRHIRFDIDVWYLKIVIGFESKNLLATYTSVWSMTLPYAAVPKMSYSYALHSITPVQFVACFFVFIYLHLFRYWSTCHCSRSISDCPMLAGPSELNLTYMYNVHTTTTTTKTNLITLHRDFVRSNYMVNNTHIPSKWESTDSCFFVSLLDKFVRCGVFFDDFIC